MKPSYQLAGKDRSLRCFGAAAPVACVRWPALRELPCRCGTYFKGCDVRCHPPPVFAFVAGEAASSAVFAIGHDGLGLGACVVTVLRSHDL